MSLQPYSPRNGLAEPKPEKDAANKSGLNHSEYGHDQSDRIWLRAQLLVGKNSPLCDPVGPAHFDELRARIKRTFAQK